MESRKPLQLLALNHVSRVCSDLDKTYRFYTEVLGFTPVKRPSSFNFEGAWLHNYGIGLHLIKGCPPPRPKAINPKSCHISFQAASLKDVEDSLLREGIPFVKNVFVEDGVQVGQLFFHDPDDNMIEICNCDVLPVVPLKDDHSAAAVSSTPATAMPLPSTETVMNWTASPTEQELAAPLSISNDDTGTSSDAGSDIDSMHAGSEVTSLLSGEVIPTAELNCESYSADVAGHHENFGSSSFTGSAMSGLVMARDSFSMGITGSDLDWSRLPDEGLSACPARPSSFLLKVKKQVSHV